MSKIIKIIFATISGIFFISGALAKTIHIGDDSNGEKLHISNKSIFPITLQSKERIPIESKKPSPHENPEYKPLEHNHIFMYREIARIAPYTEADIDWRDIGEKGKIKLIAGNDPIKILFRWHHTAINYGSSAGPNDQQYNKYYAYFPSDSSYHQGDWFIYNESNEQFAENSKYKISLEKYRGICIEDKNSQ